jgi:hypothetical protein
VSKAIPVVNLISDLSCYYLNIQKGEVKLNNKTLSADYRIKVDDGGILSGSNYSTIKLADQGALLIGGGQLRLFGNATSNPIVTHKSGNYTFSVYAGGLIAADHATFEYMDNNGLHIFNNGLVDDTYSLNNCTFQNGSPGGSLLRFSTTQPLTIENVHFPENTWGGSCNINKSSSSGEINITNSTGGFCGDSYECDPYDLINWDFPLFDLDLKVYLEGPFNVNLMNFYLGSNIPLQQPFNVAPWYYDGSESVTMIPGKSVDWVLVELRDAPTAGDATPSTVIARQAAFVKNNGRILNMSGGQNLTFNKYVNDNLYVVIWHRNHLGVMSAYPLLNLGGVYSYDFSTSIDQAYGDIDAHKEIVPGIFGMASGDCNQDGQINELDMETVWSQQAGEKGYKNADLNLDIQVDNLDKNYYWLINNSMNSQVPD